MTGWKSGSFAIEGEQGIDMVHRRFGYASLLLLQILLGRVDHRVCILLDETWQLDTVVLFLENALIRVRGYQSLRNKDR